MDSFVEKKHVKQFRVDDASFETAPFESVAHASAAALPFERALGAVSNGGPPVILATHNKVISNDGRTLN